MLGLPDCQGMRISVERVILGREDMFIDVYRGSIVLIPKPVLDPEFEAGDVKICQLPFQGTFNIWIVPYLVLLLSYDF